LVFRFCIGFQHFWFCVPFLAKSAETPNPGKNKDVGQTVHLPPSTVHRFSMPFQIFTRIFYFLVIMSCLCGFSACVSDAASKPTTHIPEYSASIDTPLVAFLNDYRAYFSAGMAQTQTPGAAVVIVKGDSIIFQQGYGVKKVGSNDSIDLQTVFRIGSLSKGFAGVLTGILVQNGLLSWDEHVQEGFPQFSLRDKQQAKRMALWHLLSHTTGLPYHAYTNLIEGGFSKRKIALEYLAQAPISGKEGVCFSYQNAAFCVIEEVMKARTEKNYPQLLQEYILQPGGLKHASCDFQSIQGCSDKASPHFWTGSTWRPDDISPLYYNAAAAGGVNASIADMGEWLKLLLGHKPQVIAEATLDKVFSPVVKTGSERRTLGHWIKRDDASYALGWRVLQHGDDTIIYHGGYVNGFRGEIAFNRRDGIGICVLFNGSSELCSDCIPAFFDRWDAVMAQRH